MQINGFTIIELPLYERTTFDNIYRPVIATRDGLRLTFPSIAEAKIVIERMDSGDYDGEVKAHHARTWDLPASRELS